MKLTELLTSPWAIRPDEFGEIQAVINAHLRGPKLNLADIEAKLLSLDGPAPRNYEIVNRTAVIDIQGSLSKTGSAFDRIFFGAFWGMADIQEAVRQASEDPEVDTILLKIDSPGGTVKGTEDLADEVFAARDKKKVISITDGNMCSAAYWIGSQAHEVYITNNTTQVGSIGVLSVHTDWSRMDDAMGLTVTEIFSGKYKTVGSPNKPLSDTDKEVIQDTLDHIYSVFIGAVARGRGVGEQVVLENMADGKVFIGHQAVDAGLVDGVSTMDQIINTGLAVIPGVGKPVTKIEKQEADMITAEKLQAEYPEVFNAVKQLGAAEADGKTNDMIEAARAEGVQAGAEAEKKRIQDVRAQLVPGHEALIESLMFDGKTTGEQAAIQVIRAEKEAREKNLATFRADGPAPVTQGEPEGTSPAPAADQRPIEEQVKDEWDKDAKLRAEFGENYSAYLAVRKAEDGGRVKIKRG